MIHYELGDGDEPTLLFLHASIGDSRMWDPQWQAFAARRRIRVDFRCFGQSPPSPNEHSPVVDLVEILDATETDQAIVVGASMGGRVALELAVIEPHRVAGLVLACPALTGHDWSDRVVELWRAEEAAIKDGDFDRAVAINLEFWLDGPDRPRSPVGPNDRAVVADMQRQALQHAIHARAEGFAPPSRLNDMHTRLNEVQAPTLVIVGADDAADIHEISLKVESGIVDSARVVIDDAVHLPNLDQPDTFNRLLREFIDEHGSHG